MLSRFSLLAGQFEVLIAAASQSDNGDLSLPCADTRRIIEENYPKLHETILSVLNTPDNFYDPVVYVITLANLTLGGDNVDTVFHDLFVGHIMNGETLLRIAFRNDCSEATVSRRKKDLPAAFARQVQRTEADLLCGEARLLVDRVDIEYSEQISFYERIFRLTSKQAKVLTAYCNNTGKGRREIAAFLRITPNTLKRHISAILKKIGVSRMNPTEEMTEVESVKSTAVGMARNLWDRAQDLEIQRTSTEEK
jgi:DNA-binding CsgD family transcriptional regulator